MARTHNSQLTMADVDAFDLESDLPTFLESVLQKAETILQNVEEQNQVDADVLAEVVDQTGFWIHNIARAR